MQRVFIWNNAMLFVQCSTSMSLVSLLQSLLKIIIFFSFDGTNFKTEPSSQYPHWDVRALGNYRKSPFVTGHDSSPNGLKTEILDYEAGQWNQAEDYPFAGNGYK